MSGVVVSSPLALRVAAPDGTPVTLSLADGSTLSGTVSGGTAAIPAPLGAVIARVMVGEGPYFDGASAPASGHLTRWSGAPNASRSEEYSPVLGPLPRRVRFARADGTLVRSGNDAYAPGGIAVAYDAEAPLGGPVSWTATPVLADGTLGETSDAASIALAPTPPSQVVLKPVTELDRMVSVVAMGAEESGRTLRAPLAAVVGSPFPTGAWDTPLSWSGQVIFRTDTEDEYKALVEALSVGTLLMQPASCSGIPSEMYVLPQGSLAAARMAGAETGFGWQKRAWAIDLVQVERPDPIDAPLLIPDRSWDGVTQDYPSWTTLAETVPSWTALLGGTD